MINRNNQILNVNNKKKHSLGNSRFNLDLSANLLNRSKEIRSKDMESTYIGYLNEMEILKINENIQNDVNFLQLKRKISKLKKSMKKKSKHISKEYNSDNKEKNSSTNRSYNNINEFSSKRNLNFSIDKKIKDKKEKFRILEKTKSVYDSFDDE